MPSWEKEQSHVKIQLGTLSRLGSFDDDDEFSPAALSPSKSRSLVGSPYIRSIHLRSSDTGCLPPVMETESQFLPTFMRSDSLAVVRKLHKLGSSVLCGEWQPLSAYRTDLFLCLAVPLLFVLRFQVQEISLEMTFRDSWK